MSQAWQKKTAAGPANRFLGHQSVINRTAWIEPSQFLNLAKDQFLRGRMVSGTMTLERNGHGTGSVSPVPTDP